MASTYFAGMTALVWILLLSDHSVRGHSISDHSVRGHSVRERIVPTNASLVSNNQNISLSPMYHSNLTMEGLPPSPRNSLDDMLALNANRASHNISLSPIYHSSLTMEGLSPSPGNSLDDMLALPADRLSYWASIRSTGKYDNILASLNVYGLPVKYDQISKTIVSLSIGNDGPREQVENIEFGWHVWPAHYGDYDSHFFVSWTRDGYQKTGCFNLVCKGFVVDNQSLLRPGIKLHPLSERNGQQYYIVIRMVKDLTGRWYLYYGTEWNKPIGYWPLKLFNRLGDYGTRATVGGNVQFTKGDSSPPMGNGLHPSDPKGKATMIRAQYINNNSAIVALPGSFHIDRGDCYSIVRSNGDYYYGGPGGCTD